MGLKGRGGGGGGGGGNLPLDRVFNGRVVSSGKSRHWCTQASCLLFCIENCRSHHCP